MPSTKAVSISYEDWSGFLTYTGIGRVGRRSTAEFVSDWLRDQHEMSLDETIEVIRVRASNWIARIAPGMKHTFVLAAFRHSEAIAAVISNYQRWHGADEREVAKEFFISEVRPKKGAEVIVTGLRSAVSRPQRRELQRLAQRHAGEPLRVRTAITQINREASRHFPDLISEESFVQSVDQWGRGRQDNAGGTRAIPRSVFHGMDLLEMTRPFLDAQFGKGRWTVEASTSANSRDKSTVPPNCELRLSGPGTRTDYRAVLLACPPGNRAQPRAINSRGTIVGEATPIWRGPSFPCHWQNADQLVFLGHLGGLGGSAYALTESGVIIGATELPNRHSHACEWSPTGDLVDLGRALPSHSGARAINSSGLIVGWSSQHPTEGGQAHFRPTLWRPAHVPLVLHDLNGCWGEAIDVNDSGDILVMSHDNRNARALLWRGDSLLDLGLPDIDCQSFFPTKLTQTSSVIGTTIDKSGRRGAATRGDSGTWQRIFLRQHAHLTCGTERILAGAEMVSGYEIPWMWASGEQVPTYLPHFFNHHCRPTAIGPLGHIVGTATGDYCSHPVLWIPS